MAETLKGKLVWQTTKSGRERRLIFPTKKGMSIPTPFNPAQLAPSLQNRTEEEIEVDLELMSGKPVRIRPVGEAFAAAPAPAPARPPHQGRHHGRNQPQGQGSGRSQSPPAFHNPYNFIPALPRDAVTGDLGDHEPIGHHAYHADRFSGVIRIKMTVKTPLLLPDAARTVEYDQDQPAHGIKKGHKSFPVRVDAGKSYIPPTSIKGMLRSAYEAVTNSRMAVFTGHEQRLQFQKWNPKTKSAPKVDYACSPSELLSKSLHAATTIGELSPAERVFGWVNQRGKGAYRGNLRVGPVVCETSNAIEWFNSHRRNLSLEEAHAEPGLPLAILGRPKPQQARFYVAASQNGEAQADGLSKEQAGYSPGKGLRGRKVYPHHRVLQEQEYSRPQLNGQEQRDNQNRSIQGWVKPGTEFTFDLHVTNLSRVELGALVWLLSLPDEHYHRLGGGKPLGFGSVRMEIDPASTQLCDGNGWKQVYATLDDAAPPTVDRDELIRAFKETVRTSYGSPASFKNVSFIAAFLTMAKGFEGSLPIHYPRTSVPPDPAGENFRWFTANESGQKVSLPELVNGKGLPRNS